MEPSPKLSRIASHGLKDTRVVVGVLLFINLVVLWMTVVSLQRNQRHAEEAAAASARNLSQVLERDLKGNIQRIDLALFALAQEMTHQRATGGLRQGELNGFIAHLFTQFPELSSIRTADAKGRIDHGIGVRPATAFSVADRAYFLEAKRNPQSGLLISPPLVGRISGQWVVILARRLNLADGGFAGVAYATITVEQFTLSMAHLELGPHGTATLRGGNLEFYAKYPAIHALGDIVGRRESSATFQTLLKQGRTSGSYKARGGLDGEERSFAFTKVGDHSLYIHVGLGSEDYLAQTRSEGRKSWIVAGLFLLVTSGLAWMLYHAWRRERERTLEEVKELRGLLPICASCKKIRDDAGYWNQIESYVQARSAAQFTHGICPDCATKMYPDLP